MANLCACADPDCKCLRHIPVAGRPCKQCGDGDHRYEEFLGEDQATA
jgi:hypothetical protein